jgi:hypothetical protein
VRNGRKSPIQKGDGKKESCHECWHFFSLFRGEKVCHECSHSDPNQTLDNFKTIEDEWTKQGYLDQNHD